MIRIGYLLRFSKVLEFKLTPPQLLLKEKLDTLAKDLTFIPEEKGFFGFFRKNVEHNTKGVYIYGGVGQGKTMLMDLFYDNVKVPKHRIHFHEFMIDIQNKLHKNRKDLGTKNNPLTSVCREIVKNYKLLCLDEFHVTHISDAMILKELFTNLFSMGLTLVCTSNRAPEELYKNGLNRDRFLPFIPILYKYCDIFNLNAEDFRQKKVTSIQKLDQQMFHVGKSLNYFLEEYSNINKIKKDDIKVRSLKVTPLRSVKIPYCHGNSAFFNFSDFSSSNQGSVGTDSFIQIANNFHTIYICEVPGFDTNIQNNNQLRIFIQLIDILYEKNTKLVLSTIDKPLIHIFGLYGVIKIFNDFYEKVRSENLNLSENMDLNQFIKFTKKYKISEKDSTLLFNSTLLPNETTLNGDRLCRIINTYGELTKGNYPEDFVLYKLDVYSDNINEDEFQCSRAMSRLFHMSSNDYLEKHKKLYR